MIILRVASILDSAINRNRREMCKEDYREFKKKVDEQERAIKLGYETSKAKVKKLQI